ncbi:MAG TPA: hypothetical protein VNT79_14355 [Phycisphaerae bacterium]|nr:hypothetical protein [Phycisphaerae bacterium]
MNSRKKKVVVVLALGSVLLVWRIFALIQKYGPQAAEATEAVAATPAPMPAPANSRDAMLETRLAAQRAVEKQSWGRNPFSDVAGVVRRIGEQPVQQIAETPVPPVIRFSGTSKSADQWMVAIDGNIHRIGDMVLSQYKIIGITRHTMTLEFGGWTYTYEAGRPGATVAPFREESR